MVEFIKKAFLRVIFFAAKHLNCKRDMDRNENNIIVCFCFVFIVQAFRFGITWTFMLQILGNKGQNLVHTVNNWLNCITKQ